MTDQPAQSRELTRAPITIPADVADTFSDLWAEQMLADDLGTKLTCREVEALAELLEALGTPEAAQMWIDMHADGDEPDDQHYRGADLSDDPTVHTEKAKTVRTAEKAKKLAKLLAHAESTDNPYEAKAYISHAKRLMTKWGVEEASVRASMAGGQRAPQSAAGTVTLPSHTGTSGGKTDDRPSDRPTGPHHRR